MKKIFLVLYERALNVFNYAELGHRKLEDMEQLLV